MNLAYEHARIYSAVSQSDRLQCLDMTSGSFNHLQRNIRERNERESVIPAEDVGVLVEQIITYPFLGGKKGSLKLIEDQKALIGETFYKEIKEYIRKLAEEELFHRRYMSELQQNFASRQESEKKFEKPFALFVNDVWSIDYMFITFLGFKFAVCVIYDIFSQSYVALVPGEVPCGQLAKKAFLLAMKDTSTMPHKCLLSDNDGTFCGGEFHNFLISQNIKHTTIPKGKPWCNGEIESGNRDLRKALLTLVFKKVCDTLGITKKGQSRQRVADFLRICCGEIRIVLNTEIPRLKFKTTPQKVCDGLVEEQEQKRKKIIEEKKQQRKKRMITIKKQNNKSTGKTLIEKTKKKWKEIAKGMSIEQLFAFNETINGRFQAITV